MNNTAHDKCSNFANALKNISRFWQMEILDYICTIGLSRIDAICADLKRYVLCTNEVNIITGIACIIIVCYCDIDSMSNQRLVSTRFTFQEVLQVKSSLICFELW